MTVHTLDVLSALRQSVESIESRADGSQWGEVYIDNITVKNLNKHEVAGHLSALKNLGFYEQEDGDFGLVRL